MTDFPSLTVEEAQSYIHHTFSHTPEGLRAFRDFILNFYKAHGRDLAWRLTRDPYKILVSEVMLQQTQVSRFLPKYDLFLSRWPDFQSLAQASTEELLSVWKGLGYNRRALRLRESARMSEAWGWTIPNDKTFIDILPGVGKSTSAALRSFCFGEPSIYLETNVRRVLLTCFFPQEEGVKDVRLEALLQELIQHIDDTQSWYYALMDYGVLLKALQPNANRRSAHYTKQGKFEDSNRQIRGLLIHLLTDTGAKSLTEICTMLPTFEQERILYSLGQLSEEGFVQERDALYKISED